MNEKLVTPSMNATKAICAACGPGRSTPAYAGRGYANNELKYQTEVGGLLETLRVAE